MRSVLSRSRITVALVLLLAACSGAGGVGEGDSAGGGVSEAATTDGATSPPTESAEGADGAAADLRVGYASDLDSADIAALLGLNELGIDDPVIASEDSAIIAGLVSGEFDVGNADMLAAMLARRAGAPITVLYPELLTYQYIMIAQPEIETLDDLAGKTVAYHSPGSEDEILVRSLVRQHDPALEDQIDWRVVPESPNRAAALIGGEIDATALEFGDTLTVEDEIDVTTLGGWDDVEGPSASAIANSWVVSDDFLAENEAALTDFITAAQDGYDTFYADKDAWMDLAVDMLPDVSEDRLSQTYDFFAEVELYPMSGGEPALTPERWNTLNEFFVSIDQLEEPAPDEMVAFDIIQDVSGGE